MPCLRWYIDSHWDAYDEIFPIHESKFERNSIAAIRFSHSHRDRSVGAFGSDGAIVNG